MAFALIIVGVVLLVSGIRNSQGDLFSLLQQDFTGPNNFIFWVVAILAIGAIGYIPKLKPISTGLMVLVILAIFLRRGKGFFSQLTSGLQSTTTTQPAAAAGSGASPAAGGGLGLGALSTLGGFLQ